MTVSGVPDVSVILISYNDVGRLPRAIRSLQRQTLRALEIIDGRADLLETEKLITGDRYTFLRNLYVQRRQFLLGGKVAEPSFDDEFDDEEF